MFSKRLSVLIALIFLTPIFTFSSYAKTLNISGKYLSTGAYKTNLEVTQKGSIVFLYFLGGGNPDDGDSMSGDCEIKAKGQLHNNLLKAEIVPFKGKIMSLTSEAIDGAEFDRSIKVEFDKKRAQVHLNLFGYCGHGNDMSGEYKQVEIH